MKYTEGFWLTKESADIKYASDAYFVEEIPNGMKIIAPVKKIMSRGDTLNMPVITIEFTAISEWVIGVRSYHYEAYCSGEARFVINEQRHDAKVKIDDERAVMTTGKISIVVDRKNFSYSFVTGDVLNGTGNSETITKCGFKNLSYI